MSGAASTKGGGRPARIALLVMPVVELDRPSIGLAQLRSVLERELGERVAVEIRYLGHDFARYMAAGRGPDGLDLHRLLLDNQHTGLPEWFFRQAAFPGLADNADAYFRRYYPGRAPAVVAIRDALLERRRGLDGFLAGLIDRYDLAGADLVGFTSMFTQNVASFALARALKQRRPDVVVAMGGANCETPMGQEIASRVEAVDWVFSGPGLVSFPAFVRAHLDGDRAACERVPGVFGARTVERPPAERLGPELDIDADVPLDYADFFRSYRELVADGLAEDGAAMVLLETSRGCWWGERAHCTFCGLNGETMAYRAMAPERAVGLFRSLFERYGKESSFFFSVDNIMPRSYVRDVLPALGTPPGTRIFYEVKADLGAEDLRTMAAAGVTRIQPGIESLATSTLKLMKKGTSVFVNLRLLKNCARFGVSPGWNLLVGFPGEGEEVYAKYVTDLPRVAHLPPPEGVAPVRFDRYSPYFVRAEEFGLDLSRFDFYPLIYPFDEASLARFAYYFSDTRYDAPYVQALARWIDRVRERVQSWRARWTAGDGGERPRLAARGAPGGGAVVVDTRGDAPREHALDAGQAALLALLERQRGEAELVAWGEREGVDAGAALGALDERGLVWREGDRAMSLVLSEEGEA